MKKIILATGLLLATTTLANEHDWTLYPPRIPEPKIVEVADPQVNTFCAANLSCTVTGAWSFGSLTVSGTGTFTGAVTAISANGYIYVGNSTYACTPTGLSSAIAAATNGVVDATNCTGTISSSTPITINANNVLIQLGTQTWNYGSGMGVAAITVNGAGVVFNCRPQQTIFTSATLGTTAPPASSNIFLLQGNNDEVNDCVFQGQATNNANNFQIAINAQANNQKVRRNIFTGTTGTTGFNWAINVQGTVSGHYIENNIISQIMTKSDGTGFGIITGNSPSQGFVRANNITMNTGTGQLPIYVSTATQNFEVSDNVIIGGGTNQIKVASSVTGAAGATSGNNIHDNILTGCTSCGPTGLIYLNSNTPNNRVAGNIIIGGTGNTAQGIEVDGGSSIIGTPDTNLIAGNKIQNTGEACVYLFAGNKNIVEDNECRSPSLQTVGAFDPFAVVSDGASNAASDNVFKNNVLQDGTFRSPLHIFSATPLPARTVVINNHFPCANGCIQDQGTSTVYGINNLNTAINGSGTNVPTMSGPLYVGGVNSSGTAAPVQLFASSGQFFGAVANTVALTADWTCGTGGTVASCTAATIIGSGGGVPLTFTLPLVAQSYTLTCDGVVGQATAATANQWNLLTATNGATNVTANYSMATAATASAYGAVTDQASTTTTFQIAPSWTLGGTATKMPFHIWAKIEGASASGTVVSLQLLAPTVGDLVTIYRGTACTIY